LFAIAKHNFEILIVYQFDVERRCMALLDSIIDDQTVANGATIAMFTHKFVISAIVRGILEAGTTANVRTMMHNTSITEIEYNTDAGLKGGWRLIRMNDAAHLEAKDSD
jgi:broad specificity phosphatase PhoE